VDPIYEIVYKSFSKFLFSPAFKVDPATWFITLPLFNSTSEIKIRTFDLDLKLRSYKQSTPSRYPHRNSDKKKENLQLSPEGTAIVLHDHTSRGILAIKQFAKDKKVRVVILQPSSVWTQDSGKKVRLVTTPQFQHRLQEVLEYCGNPPVVTSTDLVHEYLKKSPAVLVRSKVSCTKFTPSARLKSEKWHPVDFTPESPAYFVALDRCSSLPISTEKLSEVLVSLRRLNLISPDLPVYGIPKSQIGAALKNPNWISFFKHFQKESMVKFKEVQHQYQLQRDFQSIPWQFKTFSKSPAASNLQPSSFKSYLEEVNAVDLFSSKDYLTWRELVEVFQLDLQPSKTFQDPEFHRYPLIPRFFKLFQRWEVPTVEDFQHLVDYHNVMVSGGSNEM
jgi:hypothetical protein